MERAQKKHTTILHETCGGVQNTSALFDTVLSRLRLERESRVRTTCAKTHHLHRLNQPFVGATCEVLGTLTEAVTDDPKR